MFTEEEEENLPIFKHEDKVPDSDMSSDDEKNFINDEEESVDSHSNFENEEDSDDNSEDSNSYVNPYMERNKDIEREDILKVLSKSTEKDKSNQKRSVEWYIGSERENKFTVVKCLSETNQQRYILLIIGTKRRLVNIN